MATNYEDFIPALPAGGLPIAQTTGADTTRVITSTSETGGSGGNIPPPPPPPGSTDIVQYPIDASGKPTPTDFITSLYERYYNRAPDAPGLEFWVNQLTSGLHTFTSAENAFATTPDMSPNPGQSLAAYLQNPVDVQSPGTETYTFQPGEVVSSGIQYGVPPIQTTPPPPSVLQNELTNLQYSLSFQTPGTSGFDYYTRLVAEKLAQIAGGSTNPTPPGLVNPVSNPAGTQIVTNPAGSPQVSPPGTAPPTTTVSPPADSTGTVPGLENLPTLLSLFKSVTAPFNQIDTRATNPGVLVLPSSNPPDTAAAVSSGNSTTILVVLGILAILIPVGLHFYAKHKSKL